MSDDVRNQVLQAPSDPAAGPLRHFRVGRRAVLTSLATGVGAAVFASSASAAHVHQAATATAKPVDAASAPASQREFLDQHAFETLVLLSEQIIPGSRDTKVAEFLDRLLAVESTDTQKRFMQALGAFERQARESHGKPWKALTEAEATAQLTKMSGLPDNDPTRNAFDDIKHAVAETYYGTEAGMKELGWNGTIAFAPPTVCG